jgi:multisubunit Na+/H+ antiporter MnhC subunit
MRVLLFLLSIMALVAAGFFFVVAKSAVHEIEGLILVLTSAVLLVGAAIVEAVGRCARSRHRPGPTE